MSLCIPRIQTTITKDYIYQKLSKLEIGKIEKITEIPLKNDPTYKRILLKIQWNNTEKSLAIQEHIKKKGFINIVHEMPWFWKIFVKEKT